MHLNEANTSRNHQTLTHGKINHVGTQIIHFRCDSWRGRQNSYIYRSILQTMWYLSWHMRSTIFKSLDREACMASRSSAKHHLRNIMLWLSGHLVRFYEFPSFIVKYGSTAFPKSSYSGWKLPFRLLWCLDGIGFIPVGTNLLFS